MHRDTEILIVEDSRAFQLILEANLKWRSDYCVTMAASVSEAKEALTKTSFDVVILDYHLGNCETAEDIVPFIDCAIILFSSLDISKDEAKKISPKIVHSLSKDPTDGYLKMLPVFVDSAAFAQVTNSTSGSFDATVLTYSSRKKGC